MKLGSGVGNLATALNNTRAEAREIDWNGLREEGLKYLQAMSGHLWTDYQLHDPGVTILELLCHAITDLNARLSQDIGDILAKKNTETASKQFFSPREILTINPVTINDYRKLLIDLPGVKNAWLVPVTESRPSLYYDQDNSALLYDYASGAQRITLKGLYRVLIEKDEDVTDEEQLKKAVIERLHAHRNLCEDFVEVTILAEETISIYSDIEIDENADPDEVLGKIYYDLANFISPRVKQYSLKRMLQKGKTIEEIFNGPQLENGFIDDDELGKGEKRKELHASDLIRIIMAHPEVKDVRNLYMANKPNPDLRDKQEWALVVDDTKALVMEPFNREKLRVFKKDMMCAVKDSKVEAVVNRLKKESSREIFDDPAMDLVETLGKTTGEISYNPITYKLPSAYGVSETGLPSTVSAERKAQAKQLKAYLLFFEQILVNYLKQLDSFKKLFAFRQNRAELLKTYFTQLLPEDLWKQDFPEIEEIITNDPTEKLPFSEGAFKRKNRILDHLLAQFNEKFSDYVFFGFKFNLLENVKPEQREQAYLEAKADFLENYPQLSRNRNRAYNYLATSNGFRQVDGLKNLIAAKLGIDLSDDTPVDLSNSEEFYIVEHILFRPDASMPLDFICAEKIDDEFQPDPYSHRLTFVLPKNAGRFSNSRFKELVYTTIADETPAHISYQVVELNPEQMRAFVDTYRNFLREVVRHRQGNSDQYNLYRNTLLAILGIGRTGLPVLHLDAGDVLANGSKPEHGSCISEWKDLSLNNHHAVAETEDARPEYHQPTVDTPGFLRFTEATRLKINYPLVQNDFSIVVVFKALPQLGNGESREFFRIVTGGDPAGDHFSLGFTGEGNVSAGVSGETITLVSQAGCPHIAVFTREQKTGEIRLFLDGVLQISRQTSVNNALDHYAVEIGPGIDCDLGEVIVLDSVLTGSRKLKLEEYLAQKWDIPLSAVSSIGLPALHLAADAVNSVLKDDKTNKIRAWHDLSQGRKVISQDNPDLQPFYQGDGIGGLPAIAFHHTALVVPNETQELFQDDFTIGLIYRGETGAGRLLDGTETWQENGEYGERGFSIGLDEHGALQVQGGTEEIKLTSTLNQPHLAVISGQVMADHLLVTIWLDGKFHIEKEFKDTQIFRDCSANLILGQSRNGDLGFNGQLGEVVIYNKALSAEERQRLEEFMSAKWRVALSGVAPVASAVLHLDATRLASVLNENGVPAGPGDKVGQWSNLAGSENHARQDNSKRWPEYTRTGINCLPAIKFTQEELGEDIYDDYLSVDRVIQSDFTMMVVFRPDVDSYAGENEPVQVGTNTAWTDGVALIDADCSGRYNDFGLSFGKSGEKMIVMGGIGDRLTADHTIKSRELDFSRAHFVTFTREKASGEVHLYVDGLFHAQADLRDNVTLNDSRTIKIGAFNSEGHSFRGLIGEVILFDQVLTEGQRQRIEEYLSVKWGIPLMTLPVDAAGLGFHLDATVSASIKRDKENRITQWSDLNNLTNVTAIYPETEALMETEEPPIFMEEGIFGRPAIHFNNSWMTIAPEITSYNDFTIAIVFNALNAGNITDDGDEAGLLDHYDPHEAGNFGLTVTKNSNLRVRIGTQRIETAVTLNAPHIAIISRDQAGGKVRVYLGGLLVGAEDCPPEFVLDELKELTIGAMRKLPGEKQVSKGYFYGNLGEVCMFNRVLSERERQQLEDYLSLKWRIDISGVNSIVKPVLHLDASKLATVVTDDTDRVIQWLDLNGSDNGAVQEKPDHRPLYREKTDNELGVLHFNGKSCLRLKPVVHEDFTVIIVYRAEAGENSAYMPVAHDSFIGITDNDLELSTMIWTQLKDGGYIDAQGNVLPAFTPEEESFTLGLDATVLDGLRNVLAGRITQVLTESRDQWKTVPADTFTGLVGVDTELSKVIYLHLQEREYLNEDGRVLKADYNLETGAFLTYLAEAVVSNVILAENWLAGAGIFDGNCPGERGRPNKRDFGILVGKDGKLLVGIGVPDEQDYQIEQTASFGQWHIAMLTREKETGLVRLYVDTVAPVEKRIAHKISLKDSKRFTIGAVNTGGNYFTGDLAELIVLDRVPAAHELVVLRDYLAKKWGLNF